MATENRTNGTAIYKDLRKIKPITIEIDHIRTERESSVVSYWNKSDKIHKSNSCA